MSRFDTVSPFVARVAPGFENKRFDPLFEVITSDGERIASVSQEAHARALAEELNAVARRWANRVGFDAVLVG